MTVARHHKRWFRVGVLFLSLSCAGGCGDWPWPKENPVDPWRCDPACVGGETCLDGECVQLCGNGKLDTSEQCDGPFGGKSCGALGYLGGTLKCSACKFDVASCTKSWVTIKAGTFKMGSPSGENCRDSDEPEQLPVTLTRSFEIQTTEVTQAQFHEVMSYKPSYFTSCGATCPVDTVNWHEAAAYCNALSKNRGLTQCYACTGSGKNVTCKETTATEGKGIYACKGFRLPTEAEWEYAYRAGTTTALYNGSITSCAGTDGNAGKIGWYSANAGGTTHPAGQKDPNAWGLYDMAGNVWEWCHDGYKKNLGVTALTDPVFSGSSRVLRGGSWYYDPHSLRAADRLSDTPTLRYYVDGFRCSRTK